MRGDSDGKRIHKSKELKIVTDRKPKKQKMRTAFRLFLCYSICKKRMNENGDAYEKNIIELYSKQGIVMAYI